MFLEYFFWCSGGNLAFILAFNGCADPDGIVLDRSIFCCRIFNCLDLERIRIAKRIS